MKLPEVRDLVLGKLSPLFDGFMKRSEEGFARVIPAGRQEVAVSLVDYDPAYSFSLVMSVRLDAVEEIFHRFSGSPPKYQAMTSTSNTPVEYFLPDQTGEKEFNASNEKEVDAAVRELSRIQPEIIRFFETYRDVNALDAAMNSEKAKPFDSSRQPYRAMHGVIVAHLARNPRFEDLVSRDRTESRSWPPEDSARLDRLVSYLKQSQPG